jgi:rod shape-determining protein MreD
MIAAFVLFSATGLAFFYLQNLLFFPHVHLRVLALLMFYVGLRPSLTLALSLGLALGLLQDSYATTPFGLHLGASLALVAAARFFRRRLLLQRITSQVLASVAALALEEVCFQAGAFMFGLQLFVTKEMIIHQGWEILGTAALGPLMYLLVKSLENFLRRLGWRALSEPPAYQSFS